MKSTILSSYFFLSVIFFAVVPVLSEPLYVSLCASTSQDANVCLMLLKSDSRVTSATNYDELSKYILELAVKDSMLAQNYIVNQASIHPSDEAIRQCAQYFYPRAIELFKNALSKFQKDPQGAKNDIQGSGFESGLCVKALQEEGKKDPSIQLRNNQIFVLSEVAFLSVNHLT
ncbi:unnamed protein product [Lathyrus oleraceus]|uniref:Pectinesterase inhibitor domain-containing protein n=1 Tax=Pisum sativum TaxID=3888 RepID=A0A9D5BI35_PEA|nr:hypothetical protein KIW84_012598 [Pisum sativum]